MNNILDSIKSAAVDVLVKEGIQEMHKMLNLQHEGGTEILTNLVNKGQTFWKECKYTLIEKNGNTLDVIISRPGMEDAKYKNIQNSSNINTDVFSLFKKYTKIVNLESSNISYSEYVRGKNRYCKIIAYPDKKLYHSLRKEAGTA